jgi:hypothetical protein
MVFILEKQTFIMKVVLIRKLAYFLRWIYKAIFASFDPKKDRREVFERCSK